MQETKHKGILPDILIQLLAARKAAKKAMEAAFEAGNDAEGQILNGRQLALKISANRSVSHRSTRGLLSNHPVQQHPRSSRVMRCVAF